MKQREIKFRAWTTSGHKRFTPSRMWSWKEIEETFWEDFSASKSLLELGLFWKNPGVILMEYTGLKDINGKEIYEGDIVKFSQCADDKGRVWPSLYKDYREWIGEVGFENGSFRIVRAKYVGKTPKKMWKHIESDLTKPHWEVIGNIYENKNLLK